MSNTLSLIWLRESGSINFAMRVDGPTKKFGEWTEKLWAEFEEYEEKIARGEIEPPKKEIKEEETDPLKRFGLKALNLHSEPHIG